MPSLRPTGEPQGSFVRWHAITLAQLTYSVNLILGLAVAALGFQVTLLLDDNKINPPTWQRYAFSLSMVLLIFSIALGIWCVINRLRSFRATAQVARMREQGRSEEDINLLRVQYEKLDAMTWPLFWWQIGTFGGGVLLTILGVAVLVCQRFS